MKYWDKDINGFVSKKTKDNMPEYSDEEVKAMFASALESNSMIVSDNNGMPMLKVDVNRINENYKRQLQDLLSWFEWYGAQVEEYSRCQRKNIAFSCIERDTRESISISELDDIAEKKKAEINALRKLLEV